MSGYLARLVRRHLEPAEIRPRPQLRVAWPQPPGDGGFGTSVVGASWSAPTPATAEAPVTAADPVSPHPASAATAPRAEGWSGDERHIERERPTVERAGSFDTAAARVVEGRADAPSAVIASGAPMPPEPGVTAALVDVATRTAWGEMVPPPDDGRLDEAPRRAAWAAPRAGTRPPGEPQRPDIVRIHIGRVEVRAVPPSAPPARAPRTARVSSALSLEQYLAGKRRP
jgi:hypothetical protein